MVCHATATFWMALSGSRTRGSGGSGSIAAKATAAVPMHPTTIECLRLSRRRGIDKTAIRFHFHRLENEINNSVFDLCW